MSRAMTNQEHATVVETSSDEHFGMVTISEYLGLDPEGDAAEPWYFNLEHFLSLLFQREHTKQYFRFDGNLTRALFPRAWLVSREAACKSFRQLDLRMFQPAAMQVHSEHPVSVGEYLDLIKDWERGEAANEDMEEGEDEYGNEDETEEGRPIDPRIGALEVSTRDLAEKLQVNATMAGIVFPDGILWEARYPRWLVGIAHSLAEIK